MEKCLIVAVADDNAIGAAGSLPWHLSEDLRYFKRTTVSCPVIMGRKTYESLPFRPLKGRLNIVLSRRKTGIPGVVEVSSLEEAFLVAGKECGEEGRCFVIGGASIYSAALPEMDTLYITRVHTRVPDADSFFPEIDESLWVIDSRSETFTDEPGGITFEFEVYRRRDIASTTLHPGLRGAR